MIESIIEILSYPFIQRSLVAGLVIGVATAVLSVFITLRNMSFYANAISHSALAGIALGVMLGVPPFAAAVVFCVFLGIVAAYTSQRSSVSTDTLMGVIFAAGMALGIALLSGLENVRSNLFSYLFGDILAVTQTDVIVSTVLSVVILVYILFFAKQLLLTSFSKDFSAIRNIRINWLEYSFFIVTALAIALSIKIIGLILVSGLLVLPAAIAKNIAYSFKSTLLIAVLSSIVSTILGLGISYWMDIPSGPAIILVSTAGFILATIFRRR